MQQLGPAWKAFCWTHESGFLCSLFSQHAFGKPQKIKKKPPKEIKMLGAGYAHQGRPVRRPHPAGQRVALLAWKGQQLFWGFFVLFVCLGGTPVKWLCDCLLLLSCRSLFLSPSQCPLCKINHSWESEALLLSWEQPPSTGGDVWDAARLQRRCLQQEEA